jgi:hypothetical protein
LEKRQKNPLAMVARVIGFVAAGFFLSLIVGEFRKQGGEVTTLEAGLSGMSAGIALTGCIISWWREKLAGILMVSASAVWGIVQYAVLGIHNSMIWAAYGLPYLIAGLLFFRSRQLSVEILELEQAQKRAKKHKKR